MRHPLKYHYEQRVKSLTFYINNADGRPDPVVPCHPCGRPDGHSVCHLCGHGMAGKVDTTDSSDCQSYLA